MDQLRIGRILEEGFMVEESGGTRFLADHTKEIKLNADYRLGMHLECGSLPLGW